MKAISLTLLDEIMHNFECLVSSHDFFSINYILTNAFLIQYFVDAA